jgi:sterol desaturase/sphingolipid hydroxylase (fatty acid hydroxylase superfamily)
MLSMDTESIARLSVFLSCFITLVFAEAIAPRRQRAVARSIRWGGNLGLIAISTVLLRAIPFSTVVGMAVFTQARGWGILHILIMPPWLKFVLAVVALDCAIYVQHVLFHALPILWGLHRVHHTDPEFDVTTGVRFHPGEMVLSAGFKVSAVIVLGPPVAAALIFEGLLTASSLFSHANLRVPRRLDHHLRVLVVTPDMHRVHHSIEPNETMSNFGFNFSWWDRLCGTYRPQPFAGHDGMTIGVQGFPPQSALALHRLLAQPLR